MTRIGPIYQTNEIQPVNRTAPQNTPKRKPSKILLKALGRGFMGTWFGKPKHLFAVPIYRVVELHNTLTPAVGTLLTEVEAEHLIQTTESAVVVLEK